MMRFKIIFRLLMGKYTTSTKYKCWWVWGKNEYIMITFDENSFRNRPKEIDK